MYKVSANLKLIELNFNKTKEITADIDKWNPQQSLVQYPAVSYFISNLSLEIDRKLYYLPIDD